MEHSYESKRATVWPQNTQSLLRFRPEQPLAVGASWMFACPDRQHHRERSASLGEPFEGQAGIEERVH